MSAKPADRSMRFFSAFLSQTHKLGCRVSWLGQICQKGRGLPWSQIHGLSTNVLISRLECIPRDDIHLDAQELLQVLEQADMVKKRCTGHEVREEIQIAVWTGLASGD
jgi:hypothetical protein